MEEEKEITEEEKEVTEEEIESVDESPIEDEEKEDEE